MMLRTIFFYCLVTSSLFGWSQQKSSYSQAISPKGSLIAVSKDKLVYVYALTSDEAKFNVTMGEDIAGTGFSNDENLFVVMDYNYVFRAFDLSNEGEEVWSSDILEFIEKPDERLTVKIVQSTSGDYLLAQHGDQSMVLDRYTGELVGYSENELGYISGPLSVWPSGANGFEVMSNGLRDALIIKISVEGYGAVASQVQYIDNNIAYPVLAHYPGKTMIYNRDDRNKTEVKLHGKVFLSGKKDRVDFPTGVFSPDGAYFATGKFNAKAEVYEFASGNRISQIDLKQKPIWMNSEYVVFGGYNAQYEVFSVKNGKQILSTDREDDLKYKGSGITKSARAKEAGVIFFDDFDDNFNEWNTSDSPAGSEKIVEGHYVLTSSDKRYGIWNSKIGLDQFRDFEIEVRLKSDTEDDDQQFGISWGRNSEYGYRDVFRLKNKGAFYIGKYRRGKWWASQSWTELDEITREFNTLKVRKSGKTYTYFINDKEVFQAPFTGLMGSKIGFDYTKGTTWVDYIKVSYLTEDSQPDTRIYTEEFDDNADNWLSKRKEGAYDQQILNGYFRYEVMAEKTSYTKWNNRLFIDTEKDFIFETAIKFDASNSTSLTGLAWGRAEKGSKQYRFGFNKNGNVRIDHYDGSKYKPVVDWQRAGIDLNDYNRLKIKKVGEEFKFYVNGKLFAIEKGLTGYGPIVGFIVPPQTIAQVDYLRARYINPRSTTYRSYSSRTGKRIYIPYMRPNNPANRGGKVLIGEPLYCDRPPKMEAGGMGFATTTQKVKWDYWILDEEDEIEYGKKQLREIYSGGWLVWNHNIKCR